MYTICTQCVLFHVHDGTYPREQRPLGHNAQTDDVEQRGNDFQPKRPKRVGRVGAGIRGSVHAIAGDQTDRTTTGANHSEGRAPNPGQTKSCWRRTSRTGARDQQRRRGTGPSNDRRRQRNNRNGCRSIPLPKVLLNLSWLTDRQRPRAAAASAVRTRPWRTVYSTNGSRRWLKKPIAPSGNKSVRQ